MFSVQFVFSVGAGRGAKRRFRNWVSLNKQNICSNFLKHFLCVCVGVCAGVCVCVLHICMAALVAALFAAVGRKNNENTTEAS